MIKQKTFILYLFFSFIIAFTSFFGVKAIPVTRAEEIKQVTNFETGSLLEELNSIDGFAVSDYPFSNSKELSVFTVIEYCYTQKDEYKDNFGLYIYLYNPQKLQISENGNRASIAISFNDKGEATRFEYFDLKYINKTTGEYNGLFYKFKVVDHESNDGKTIYSRVDASKRVYDFGGLQLRLGEQVQSYRFGLTCEFTGYGKGLGPEETAESTLKGNVESRITLSLDVKSTYFRPEYAYKDNTSMQLNSVYFSIPNSYVEEYGEIDQVDTTWYEYTTAPILVVSSSDIFISQQWNSTTGLLTFPSKYAIYGNREVSKVVEPYIYYSFDWAYNNILNYHIGNENSIVYPGFYYIFLSEEDDYYVSGETITDWFTSYSNDYTSGEYIETDNWYISANLFDDTVDDGRTRGYNEFSIKASDNYSLEYQVDTNHPFWSFLFGPNYETIAPEDNPFSSIQGIQKVSISDLSKSDDDLSSLYYVDNHDITEFRNYVNEDRNATTYMCHFSVTDYFASEGLIFDSTVSNNPSGISCMLAQETVFLDFNVINVTFKKDDVYKVVPVVATPVDIVAGLAPPPEYKPAESSDFPWWGWLIVIGVLILLAPLIFTLVPILFKVLWWLICLPFRLIAWFVSLFTR